ncbi:hypothetical protein BCV69DRAFT_283673 [Microstroma glucosiphilum]|uniref:Uncharacterized protein n=1 Tax=Pseudomicrostroma glucosiphilum TaxID=1684307 RepID=A0A316U4F5_9BASI|nr:hypothetical protein BCV69DRAFT_283673 [Pseudomicrostroma glucosiphilum]PWN20139.1 hypothetical protein BCV69DRAFT_283673 [Pseudomicrostroma glucosiphilum]
MRRHPLLGGDPSGPRLDGLRRESCELATQASADKLPAGSIELASTPHQLALLIIRHFTLLLRAFKDIIMKLQVLHFIAMLLAAAIFSSSSASALPLPSEDSSSNDEADFPFRPHRIKYCFHGDNTLCGHDCFQEHYVAKEQYLRHSGSLKGPMPPASPSHCENSAGSQSGWSKFRKKVKKGTQAVAKAMKNVRGSSRVHPQPRRR